jgi:hypothetical protein
MVGKRKYHAIADKMEKLLKMQHRDSKIWTTTSQHNQLFTNCTDIDKERGFGRNSWWRGGRGEGAHRQV